MAQTTAQRSAAPPVRQDYRLLAVRIAGAAYDSYFSLRSVTFETALAEWQAIREALSGARTDLVDALYQAVPRAPDVATRRQILEIKRNVFNGRSFDALPSALPPPLVSLWQEYATLAQRQSAILEKHRGNVFAEVRLQVDQLLHEERFILGCGYASPTLRAALGRRMDRQNASSLQQEPESQDDFSRLERGVYSYAARFISKANPFHLFGKICLPKKMGIRRDCDYEVVLDLATIFNLEERCLPRTGDPKRVWLALSPFLRRADSYCFWVRAASDFELVSVASSKLLRLTEDFFQVCRERFGRPTGTRAEWREFVLSRLPLEQQKTAERGLDALMARGIVTPYLVTDFALFAPALTGLDRRLDVAVEMLQCHHLARPHVSELRVIADQLTGAEQQLPAGTAKGYFLNSYRQVELGNRCLDRVAEDLLDLKPFFSLRNNFARHEYVIRSFLLDYLSQRKEMAVPYLEVLAHFLRHRLVIIPRYQPEVHRSVSEQRRIESWYARLAAQEGVLTPTRLTDLAAVSWAKSDRALCFNGPFDFVDDSYYITNIFAGEGRYLSRYLPGRYRVESPLSPRSEDVLDVELAVPLRLNLNYAAPRFETGCGFESRYAHRYRHWLDPADILVEGHGQKVIYRHARSRQRLRPRFCGLQLAQYLPPEYQLLLFDHADVYSNPFQRLEVPGNEVLEHDPALCYGTVCLRRESWRLDIGLLGELLRQRDILRFSVSLRTFVHENLAVVDAWYYRALGARSKHKPRFLDLRNPLSVSAFRSFLQSIPADNALHLSAMQPSSDHLFREGGESLVTELMIEV